MNTLDKINKAQCRKDIPEFKVGDSVKVYTKIVEGNNERIQVFAGVVITRTEIGRAHV